MFKKRIIFFIGLMLSIQSVSALPGDVAPKNSPDGQINSGDALITLQMIRGMLPADYNADVAPIGAPDGVIDIEDVKALQGVALGLQSISDLTLAQANSAGLLALANENLPGAKHLFDIAVDKVQPGSSQADWDTAYFFRAMTRVLVFLLDLSSDQDPTNGLQRFSDVIEGFGCTAGHSVDIATGGSWNRIDNCPYSMPTDSPDGAALQDFLYGPFRDELLGALDDFSKVSTGFDLNWNTQGGGDGIDNDYGDLLVFKGLFELMISQLDFVKAYDLGVDIDDADQNMVNLQSFMANHPTFLSLVDNSKLIDAGTRLDQAFADLDAGINFIQSESDNQTNDFVNLIGATPGEIAGFQDALARGRSSLAGTAVPATTDTAAGTMRYMLTLSNLYSNLDLRAQWPSYTGNNPGFFPDPTLNGTVSNVDIGGYPGINVDVSGDGIPDILQ